MFLQDISIFEIYIIMPNVVHLHVFSEDEQGIILPLSFLKEIKRLTTSTKWKYMDIVIYCLVWV